MKPIFEFENYKDFLNFQISQSVGGGRGVASKLAKALDVSPVMVSQVLRGNRNFSKDRIFMAAEFFRLNPAEIDYLLTLFDFNMAKDNGHREFHRGRLLRIRSDIQINSLNRPFLDETTQSGTLL